VSGRSRVETDGALAWRPLLDGRELVEVEPMQLMSELNDLRNRVREARRFLGFFDGPAAISELRAAVQKIAECFADLDAAEKTLDYEGSQP